MLPEATASATGDRSRLRAPLGNTCLAGKKVAIVTFSSYPADPRPRRAIDALLTEGMSVDLICLGDSKEPWREHTRGLNVLRIPLSHRRQGKLSYAFNYSTFLLISAAVQALRSVTRRYDLVHVHNMPDVLVFSALVPKIFGAKVMLDMHDPMPELMTTIYNRGPESVMVRVLKLLEKRSMAWADLVITVNLACKRIFAARSCGAEKIGLVMNSPDEEIFPFRPADSYPTRTGREAHFTIMYHGSLVERNGLDIAVEALGRLRGVVPGAQLKIYGRATSFLEDVLRNAREKNLGDCVQYLGPRSLEDLVREIENCDLGIIPNQRSAFTEINTPTRIFEYLALGKPVIAPRTAGICEYFDDQSIVFFEAGDAQDLADKAAYVVGHPQEVTAIVTRGQAIQQAHCWSKERRRFIGLVTSLLSGKGLEAHSSDDCPAIYPASVLAATDTSRIEQLRTGRHS